MASLGMKTLGIVGHSGAGKTTLLVRLLLQLIDRGLTVSTMKHTHHDVDMDTPGKDSHRHREAGAHEVMVASSGRFALMQEYRGTAEPTMEELIARMAPVDLLLIEGFKRHPFPKIEVWRAAARHKPLYPGNASIIAVAADGPLPDVPVDGEQPPVLDLGNAAAIADFIITTFDLARDRRHAAS